MIFKQDGNNLLLVGRMVENKGKLILLKKDKIQVGAFERKSGPVFGNEI